MPIETEADRIIAEARHGVDLLIREFWDSLRLPEIDEGMIDLDGLERAQIEASLRGRDELTRSALASFGPALVFVKPGLAEQRRRPN